MNRAAMIAMAASLMAGPAVADPPAAEVEALMADYIRLWNAGDGAAITSRIYRFDDTANPMQTRAGFEASYAQLKAQGYARSETHSIRACLLSPTVALAEMRYSRLKTDGTAMPPKDRATLYLVRKRAEGWRIAQMIGMDASAKLDCTSASR